MSPSFHPHSWRLPGLTFRCCVLVPASSWCPLNAPNARVRWSWARCGERRGGRDGIALRVLVVKIDEEEFTGSF